MLIFEIIQIGIFCQPRKFFFRLIVFLAHLLGPVVLFGQSGELHYPFNTSTELSKNKVKEILIAEGPEQKITVHYFFNSGGYPFREIIKEDQEKKDVLMIKEMTYNKDSSYRKYRVRMVTAVRDTVTFDQIENFYTSGRKLIKSIRTESLDQPRQELSLFDTINPRSINKVTFYFLSDLSDTVKRVIQYRNNKTGLYLMEEKVNNRWIEIQKHKHRIEHGKIVFTEEYKDGLLLRSYSLPDSLNKTTFLEEENFNPLPYEDQPRREIIVTRDIGPYAQYVQADRVKEYRVITTYDLVNREKVASHTIISSKTDLVLEINYPENPNSSKKFEYVFYTPDK